MLQSAMEYLMTYGWAILIIAVVLGALFGLGFFNSANLAPKVSAGSCQVYRPQGPGTTSFINLEGTCNNELPQYVAQFKNGYMTTPIPSSASLSQGTVIMWIKKSWANNPNSGQYGILGLGGSYGVTGDSYGDSNALEIFKYGGDNNWYFRMGSAACSITVPDTSFLNYSWYQVAMEWGGSPYGEKVWIDGGSPNVCTGGSPSTVWALPTWFIGKGYQNSVFYGYLANLQVYNSSLTANEVTALYDEGIGGVPIDLSRLVGWWPLNGNANDYSGNLNNVNYTSGVNFTGSWASGYTAP